MKKNLLKRIGAVALAVAVSLTMGTAAFAAETFTDKPNVTTDSNTVTIEKTLELKNAVDGITAYAPGITYVYTITAPTVSSNVTVTDVEGDSAKVNSFTGTLTDVFDAASKEVAFTSADSGTITSGKYDINKEFSFTVNPAGFPHAGIYRFLVTETVKTNDKNYYGVKEQDTYSQKKYLDVYIQNGPSGLAVYGYVLFNEGTDEQNQIINKDTANKSTGWGSGTGTNDSLDVYETVNVTVSKSITGSLADKTHAFPFSFTVSNPNTASKYTYKVKNGNEVTAQTFGETVNGAYGADVALADGESFVIYGLPKTSTAKSTVTVNEQNTAEDTYKVTTTGLATNLDKASTATNATAGGATAEVSADSPVTFENNLSDVSPTNVVMRFAPYLFILGAAIVLLVMMRRRKAHNAE